MTKIRPSLPDETDGLARRLASHRLFHRMIARQQIELASIEWPVAEGIVYRGLHACAQCPGKAACALWHASDAPPPSYVRFCPNTETFEVLRIMAA